MSIYTNDVDTLRQLIGQSIPQVVNSSFSILTTFVSMLVLNVPLSALSVFMVIVLLYVARKIAAQSSKYFHDQQNDLGRVNGFIEEMMDGQKVVKVLPKKISANSTKNSVIRLQMPIFLPIS